MRPPCEVVVKKILPTVRSILAKELSDRHGLRQTEIAKKLRITQPAVSQYLQFRGKSTELEETLKEKGIYTQIKELSDEIVDGDSEKSQILEKYCNICQLMGEKKILCDLHVEDIPHLSDEGCNLCFSARKGISEG